MKDAEYSFGRQLVWLRQNAGLSQQALADRLSVTRQAVSNWERGQTFPDLDMLRSIALVLETDLNTLGGVTAPVQAKRTNKGLLVGAVLTCLVSISFLGNYISWKVALPNQQIESSPKSSQSVSLSSHRIQYTTPSGTTVITAADGRQEVAVILESLADCDSGPVKVTAELADTFCYFAKQYELRFVPGYNHEDENFSSWDDVLFWLYKAGISKGNIMTETQVENAIADFFGTAVNCEHQSTEHFKLTEKGYYPENVVTAVERQYKLISLNKLESGKFEVVFNEEDGPTITMTIVLEETLQFRNIMRSDLVELSA